MIDTWWPRWAMGPRGRVVAALIVFMAALDAVAYLALWPRLGRLRPDAEAFFHGFVDTLDGTPPLARWDSIWYHAVATEGYTGVGRCSHFTPAFLPFYPLLMRATGDAAGCGYFTAGLWVSRIALLASLLLLPHYVAQRETKPADTWQAMAALLAFPLAFILASVYCESLFLALALAAFTLAYRQSYGAAALAAAAAALTRIQGLALIPALAVLGWQQWRAAADKSGPPGPAWRALARAWLPAAGAAGAYIALGAYFWLRFGDPLRTLAVRYEWWRQEFTLPWKTLDASVESLDRALERPALGTIYTVLELPCFYLGAAAVAALCVRRWWPEATYVGCALALSVFSGSLAGLPRYTLVLFPVFMLLGELRRRPLLWGLYLVAGLVLQVCLLMNFARFGDPPP